MHHLAMQGDVEPFDFLFGADPSPITRSTTL